MPGRSSSEASGPIIAAFTMYLGMLVRKSASCAQGRSARPGIDTWSVLTTGRRQSCQPPSPRSRGRRTTPTSS
eukprot:9202036-Pyramimonas_sp.AAC.1